MLPPHRTLALVCLCVRLYQPGLSVCLREKEKERERARAREREREGEKGGEGEGESLAVCLTARLSERHTSV